MRNIPKSQVLRRIKTENPWWHEPSGTSGAFGHLRPRPYLDLFHPLASDTSIRRATVLMGPRRVGKTVLIHHSIDRLLSEGVSASHILYVSVDHPLYTGLGLDEFLELYREASGTDPYKTRCYVFFDEIQYLRDWERYLKSIVDLYPSLKCVASGSAAAALRLKSVESGAGRFTDFFLPSLTFHEFLALTDADHLVRTERNPKTGEAEFESDDIAELNRHFLEYLNYGGYPEVALSDDIRRNRSQFIKGDIIDKVLLRDLPSLYGIHDVQELNYLFTTLAFNTANEVSLDELSKGAGISKNTIRRYIEYLESAFLIRIVHRVDRSARRFKRANFFKVYLTNPTIRAALFEPVDSEDQAMGSLVETAVFSQWFHSDARLHYARWNRGEVDIVLLNHEQKAAWAVEVKWSNRFIEHPGELRSLLSFCRAQNLPKALVTTRTRTGRLLLDNIALDFQPASLYCYRLGYNIVKGKRLTPVSVPAE